MICRYQETEGIHEVIESNLTESIIECINNEIVLRSITDNQSLFQVLSNTIIIIIVVTRYILLYSSS